MARFQVELTEQEQRAYDIIKRKADVINDADYIYASDVFDGIIEEFGNANTCWKIIGELSRKGWIDIVDTRFGVCFWIAG